MSTTRRIEMAGKRFGIVNVLRLHHTKLQAYWLCICDCGVEFIVCGNALRSGEKKSCGCLDIDHRFPKTHGDSKTRFYGIWVGIKARVENIHVASYTIYGGRGITISPEWSSYEKFKEDMFQSYKEHLLKHEFSYDTTIDRIDTNLGYERSNCKWSTQKEQNNNRRDNVKISYEGVIYTYQEASIKFGVRPKTIGGRLSLGWTIEQALTTPTGGQRKITA